jgi:hypothetical protein
VPGSWRFRREENNCSSVKDVAVMLSAAVAKRKSDATIMTSWCNMKLPRWGRGAQSMDIPPVYCKEGDEDGL